MSMTMAVDPDENGEAIDQRDGPEGGEWEPIKIQ
jgi:hypothetical protein